MTMSTSLDHLLPAPEDSPRCAEHARHIGLDPAGTAIRADRLVLVETPLPWPKPALDHPELQSLAAVLAQSSRPTRLLAVVPTISPPDDGSGTKIVVYDRNGGSAVERRYQTSSQEQSIALARALADDNVEAGQPYLVAEYQVARPTVLICTQGSHDVCCGSEGTRLAAELDATMGVFPIELFRVSHTGGHRFAPTAMTLPDGRMWAGLTAELLRQIVAHAVGPAELVGRVRGWWGAEAGRAQVAELAVWNERGWDLDRHDRKVDIHQPTDGPAVATVVVGPASGYGAAGNEAPAEQWQVEVAEGRAVPTIACRQAGGMPAKWAPELNVVSVSRTG